MKIEQIYRLYKFHSRVETDSRKIENGCLFFALKGNNFNGNQFAGEALEKGAAYAIVDEAEYCRSEKTILVKNVLETLQDLAHFHRNQLGLPILAITGSNGKTTTKELITSVLSSKYRVSSTQGNLNNHIGVPLTLLKMDEKTEIGVVEMGANHPGEISELCSIADPDFGIITNIGRAHLEGFGSFETIKKTKSELYEHLKKKNGIVFFNSDNPVLAELTAEIINKIEFGQNDAGFSGTPVINAPYICAKVNFSDVVLTLETNLTGSFNFENIMAAACIGYFFKVNPESIQAAIKNYRPENNRSQLIKKNGVKIIMDAYNANPTSMQASIESFVSMFDSPRSLILGDMLELGNHSEAEHNRIIQQIQKYKFEKVYLVGPVFEQSAGKNSFFTFTDVHQLCRHLKDSPVAKGAILIKGSRGIQLEKILEFL